MISVIGLTLGTIPDFQVKQHCKIVFSQKKSLFKKKVTEYFSSGNQTVTLANGTSVVEEKIVAIRMEHPSFVFTERICIAFFTIEYALRLFAAPRKLRFALKPLNLVGICFLLLILPFHNLINI
jgi:hypothetical protein